MADSTTRYVPRDYRRVCDVCGMLRNISQMHKQDELWVCTYDYGERVRTELDRGNARQRPFTIKPVPHAKPWDNYYPNTLETDDAAVFNFLAEQVSAQCRYEIVQSGLGAPYTSQGEGLAALSWAARYYYDLIIAGDRTLLIPKAKELLATIADYLYSRQRGGGLVPSAARVSDPWWGAFLESGASTYITQDTATSGLAMLYAYRILGTQSYLASARAAASYLRNVQAIGRYAAQFTSTNAAGTARLYTGAVASEVSTAFGVDPGEIFYSTHLFYPSGLVALEFWNELKLTDGDQTIGATGTCILDAFVSAPSQLLSQSITDMRTCWEVGITDSTATLINGLSTTTPKEFFNAYPAVKRHFPSLVGTGLWEYVDGTSDDGTQVSGQNFAQAISSLYNYEGATSQVTGLSDWLRTFTSNPDFETADNTSTSELYHQTTGEYDPTATIATLLLVRDADDSYAAIKLNGSSLYDWGAFGLLSRLWASRYTASFRQSRLFPLNTVQRFFDGNDTDGLTSDRITLRGLSGLSMQSGFATNINGSAPGSTAYVAGTTGITSLPAEGLILQLEGDVGLTPTTWQDQSPQNQGLNTVSAVPPTVAGTINGLPTVTFPAADDSVAFSRNAALKDRNGNPLPYTSARTIMAVIQPTEGGGVGMVGGPVFSSADNPNFECLFEVEQWGAHADAWFIFDNLWSFSGYQRLAPDTTKATWRDVVVLAEWRSSGYPNLAFAVNGGGNQPLTTAVDVPTTEQAGAVGVPPGNVFTVGNAWNAGGALNTRNYRGLIGAVYVWDYELTGSTRGQAVGYIAGKWAPTGLEAPVIAVVNDAVRAAQFGRSFREARN